jgi:hypothetical protein
MTAKKKKKKNNENVENVLQWWLGGNPQNPQDF